MCWSQSWGVTDCFRPKSSILSTVRDAASVLTGLKGRACIREVKLAPGTVSPHRQPVSRPGPPTWSFFLQLRFGGLKDWISMHFWSGDHSQALLPDERLHSCFLVHLRVKNAEENATTHQSSHTEEGFQLNKLTFPPGHTSRSTDRSGTCRTDSRSSGGRSGPEPLWSADIPGVPFHQSGLQIIKTQRNKSAFQI